MISLICLHIIEDAAGLVSSSSLNSEMLLAIMLINISWEHCPAVANQQNFLGRVHPEVCISGTVGLFPAL